MVHLVGGPWEGLIAPSRLGPPRRLVRTRPARQRSATKRATRRRGKSQPRPAAGRAMARGRGDEEMRSTRREATHLSIMMARERKGGGGV
eukprot:3275442-Pyramimonas_sp.AAC.1